MKINSIQFRQGEAEEGAIPSEVTVTMSIVEAAQIAKIFGEFADVTFEKRGWPVTHMYSDLSGDLFNRYWEDGVDEALRDIRKGSK